VVLPLMLPGATSTALFSFVTSFGELMISLVLADIRSETLPVRIGNILLLEVEPTIAAVSTLFIGVTVVALVADWSVRQVREQRTAR
jgi:putative spermidine/putrescine transport system permease protein